MIRLRLFSSNEPSRQIDQRMIGEDVVVIGRDAGVDWVIHDPDRALSRRHCSVRAVGAGIGLRDLSANGTFTDSSEDRIPPGVETIVAPGGNIRLGTFSISVEALAADRPAPEPVFAPAAPTPSLFAPPRGLDPVQAPSRPARPDPFASQLAPDPLIAEHRPADRVALGDGDAWDRRPAARAGDWNLPPERTDHENLIGSPRDWSEPPRPERDAGFGFDAPFDRPVLAPVNPRPSDVAIPADWAVSPAAPPLADPPLSPPPPPPAIVAAPDPIPAPPAMSAALPLAPLPPLASPPPAPAIAPLPPLASPPPASPPVPMPPASQPYHAPAASTADAMLFEAFCAGARLSPLSFAGEDRAAAMTRLGEVYRGMVLGLADLMGERTALKNEYRMTRTMVRPEANNPFKWAPPQRLAIEILRGGDAGFAGGAQAVSESFRDVKVHILCMLAGMRAAIATTMTALSPATAEAALDGRSYLIKAQREAALWNEYLVRFERFRLDADDSADGPVNRAFRTAYEEQLNALVAAEQGYAGGPGERR